MKWLHIIVVTIIVAIFIAFFYIIFYEYFVRSDEDGEVVEFEDGEVVEIEEIDRDKDGGTDFNEVIDKTSAPKEGQEQQRAVFPSPLPKYKEYRAPAVRTEQDRAADLKFEDDTIYFSGNTNVQEYIELFEAIENYDKAIKKIVITSWGGDTYYGKLIGEWVYDNKIDVQVRKICFSSCANYIFPAGDRKYIEDGALVGWHGNVLGLVGDDDDSESRKNQLYLDFTRKQFIRDTESLDIKKRREARENFKIIEEDIVKAHIAEKRQEREFYRVIGVDPDIANYFGKSRIISQHEREIAPGARVLGHTFTIKDMEKFGVRDVIYLGDGRYPETRKINGEIILEIGL
ncbi:MAG: hypothetical protein OXU73_01435 [Candidatus Campbellbacteria bacterium]|nr:hypothetical protein [Candidatus Campbellbacteria bacterium]